MFAQKVKEQNLNAESNASRFPELERKLLVEEASDFSDFADYRRVCVPIRCGTRTGVVCTFSHKDNLNSKVDTFYMAGLKNLIEYKKYIESEKMNFDVGPAYAIAAAIEDGDYSNFLLQFQKDVKMKDFEHIFQVKENGNTYHILPSGYDTAFGNIEQMGLIRFSILKAFGGSDFIKERNEINMLIIEWLGSNNSENAKGLRNILNVSKRKSFSGISREFSNCIIYENIFDRIKTSFELESLVSRLKSLTEGIK
ncbi:MAG: hypothetical protein N3G74_00795 [Candidatus Micrarchaeota archaeon]|nr:hypothetical protein [Candidatus Micrarchaeota archaeon]